MATGLERGISDRFTPFCRRGSKHGPGCLNQRATLVPHAVSAQKRNHRIVLLNRSNHDRPIDGRRKLGNLVPTHPNVFPSAASIAAFHIATWSRVADSAAIMGSAGVGSRIAVRIAQASS